MEKARERDEVRGSNPLSPFDIKETNTMDWFKHKTNLSDTQAFELKFSLHVQGYGVYMILLELLASSPDGRLKLNYDLLAARINGGADSALIKSVVEDFGLFKLYDDGYFSCAFIDDAIEETKKASEAAKAKVAKRWSKAKSDTPVEKEKYNSNTAVLQQQNCSNTDKIREEKIREDNNNISIKNDGCECKQLPLLPAPSEAVKEVKATKQEQLQLESDFSFFWTIYPKKQGKKEALRAYLKARKKISADTLLSALREVKQKDWRSRELQYIPHASTWLNQERWNDEVQEQKKADPLDDLDLETNPFDF